MLNSASVWTFPVIIRVPRNVAKHEHSSATMLITYPTLLDDSASVLTHTVELPCYNEAGLELALLTMVGLAREHLVQRLNARLSTDPEALMALTPKSHAAYMREHPLSYKECGNYALYKEKVKVSLSELDFCGYPPVKAAMDKQAVVNGLIKEILDDELVAQHWQLERLPDVGLMMTRDQLTVSLLNNEVAVYVLLHDTAEKCELVFDLWDAVRLYSALQRRRFREYWKHRAVSAKHEKRSTFYASRLLNTYRKGHDD